MEASMLRKSVGTALALAAATALGNAALAHTDDQATQNERLMPELLLVHSIRLLKGEARPRLVGR